MKKSSAILSLTAAASLTLTGCLSYPPATIVDGGAGWFPGDYAPLLLERLPHTAATTAA